MYSNLPELFTNVFSPDNLPKKMYDNFHPVTIIKAVFLELFHLEWPIVNDYMWNFH